MDIKEMSFKFKWKASIQPDKMGHFKAGFVLGFFLFIPLYVFLPVLEALLLTVFGIQAVSFLKEVIDSYRPGRCVEFNDYTATSAGGAISVFVIILLAVIKSYI